MKKLTNPAALTQTPIQTRTQTHNQTPTQAEYLQRILNARVYDVAIETALTIAPALSKRMKNTVLLKREDTQPVFSFKLRGAYNKMAHLSPAQLAKGVIAASAGNHAQGVALGAQRLGCKAVIVMPATTPSVKIDAVKARGATVILHGESYNDAHTHARALQTEQGYTFVHPFDDPDVIAGQGTIGMEIVRQCNTLTAGKLDAVFVAIGGGGLIAGVGSYLKAVRPDVRVIGVHTVDSDAMGQSLAAGERITLADVGLFADGTAVKLVGNETFRVAQTVVDEIVIVNTDEVCAAIKDFYTDTRSIVEPSGAMAIAGMKAYIAREKCTGKTFATIACGANMNFDRLRFVAERAEVGEAREAVFAVSLPEARGSFKAFCAAVGAKNVTEFNYRMADSVAGTAAKQPAQIQTQAHVFVGVAVADRADGKKLAASFNKKGFATLDLTEDELAKSHLRHMVGGRSAAAADEVLYRFEFPERPGALMRFLDTLNPLWNISLFHYRNHGADYGRILVGIQVPPKDKTKFKAFLKTLGYKYWDETDNAAYQLFLK